MSQERGGCRNRIEYGRDQVEGLGESEGRELDVERKGSGQAILNSSLVTFSECRQSRKWRDRVQYGSGCIGVGVHDW